MSESSESQADFATLLEESFRVEPIAKGDILPGTILAIDDQGILVDVGLKRDGIVPRTDVENLDDCDFEVGSQVTVMVVRPEDSNGNLIVSLDQAQAFEDWGAAQRQMEKGDPLEGEVVACNRGGLIVPYGRLRGFVPASHVVDMPRGLTDEDREEFLRTFIGRRLTLKIIEVNPRRRRLVFSEREAGRQTRESTKAELMESLKEGDVISGVVSGLRDFGAFVDLGGADGLIHISELSWRRIRHPSEIVQVGDEVEVAVLRLDHEGMRIGLSLKRLRPNPWASADQTHHVGQVVEGIVSRVVSFGAFVELECGIEALLHISQIGDPSPEDPGEILTVGQRVTAQVISLEPHRQRMGLSLKMLDEEIETHSEAVSLLSDDGWPDALQPDAGPVDETGLTEGR